MAGVDGKWDCTIATPMGDQQFTLDVASTGDTFRGSVSGGMGSKEIDGSVDGDALDWTMNVPKPMPLTLSCQATSSGDTLQGTVKAGIFGSFPLTGTRAA